MSSRLPRRFGYEADALALPEGPWAPIAYCPRRSARLPKGRRPSFSGAEATDGLYALVAIMGPRRASAARLLALYTDQALSERAHHFLKGPIAVRPVFSKSNRRAAALVQVCSIAPLVYGLVEAEVRTQASATNASAPTSASGTWPTPSAPPRRRSSKGSAFLQYCPLLNDRLCQFRGRERSLTGAEYGTSAW